MRRPRLLLLLPLTLALAACATQDQKLPKDKAGAGTQPDYSDPHLPTVFDFSIKNAEGHVLVVHYFHGKVYVTDTRGPNVVAYKVTPSSAEWESFWKAAESVGLWEWNSGVDPGEPDSWSLKMKHDGRELSIDGTYFKRGRDGSLSEGKEGWNPLASAMQRLIQREVPLLHESMR